MSLEMLKVIDVYANYADHPVLKGLDFEIANGEVVAVIGPNGAGKTTLVRVISGVIPLQAGKILVNGKDLNGMAPEERAKLMAVVPQARQLPLDFSVHQTVMIGRTPYIGWFGLTSLRDEQTVLQAMNQTQISHLNKRRIGELSGGEQQRVLLARALAQDTPLLLMDEPTTHLDLQHQFALLNLIRKLAKEQKFAILLILHDLNLASIYADRVLLMVDGKILREGTPNMVITAKNLAEAYHINVQVIEHPEYGTPLVLPDGRN